MQPDYHSYPDARLLELITQNDEAAFREIYQRHAPAMFTSAFNILRHKTGAEDAVQEIFISFWKRRNESKIDNLQGYLSRSVHYYTLRAFKEQKRDEDLYHRIAGITEEIQKNDPLLYKEIQETLYTIIASLPQDQQLIYTLSREQNMTYAEIAQHLNISVKTVEKKMSLALKTIRPQMDKLLILASCLAEYYG